MIILQKLDVRTELVVDCVRAGPKKKRGVEEPPLRGVWGEAEPPPFANVLAFLPRKSLEKRMWSINSSNNNNNTIEIKYK